MRTDTRPYLAKSPMVSMTPPSAGPDTVSRSRDHALRKGAYEDLLDRLGGRLRRRVEPEAQPRGLAPQRVVEVADGEPAVRDLPPALLACGDGVRAGREHDDQQRTVPDRRGHLSEVVAEDDVLGDHGEPGLEVR